MSIQQKCPKCGRPMVCLGNINGFFYTVQPQQEWDDTYACYDCKVKKRVRKKSHGLNDFHYAIDDFEDMTDQQKKNSIKKPFFLK